MLEPARTGVPVHSDEDWFIRRDGSLFPVSFTSVPIDLPTGRGVVVTFIDLTAQREAEQALRERDAILARVAQPVWVVDHEGRFHYANPAALAALGYDDPAELVGRPGPRDRALQVPRRPPFPAEDCPLTQARDSGRDPAGPRGLARAQGRLDPADRLLDRAVRPPGGRGSVTAFTDIEAQPRGGARRARARRRRRRARRSCSAARRRMIEAADAARAQLTRDLHDGAQQQFVSARRHVQLAEKQAASDPEAAAQLRQTALEQTKAGLRELRDLAAGIHPGDPHRPRARRRRSTRSRRGSRCPSPSSTTLDRRLPTPVEASLYFFVSEALTNIVKHAGAERGLGADRHAEAAAWPSTSPTTGSAARRRPPAAPGSPASPTASPRSTAS